jgi:hypothetical protein
MRNRGKEVIKKMEAQNVLERLNGWNEPAKVVPENDLPDSLRHEGTGCDCRGCDKD